LEMQFSHTLFRRQSDILTNRSAEFRHQKAVTFDRQKAGR
jgi:hypothetical protein